MYKVISLFTDLQDFDYLYKVGDTFPRRGKEVTQARLDELSGSANKQGRPLIKKITANTEDVVIPKTETTTMVSPTYTKTEINRMSKADLVTLAEKEGIAVTDETSGAELKTALIKHFDL